GAPRAHPVRRYPPGVGGGHARAAAALRARGRAGGGAHRPRAQGALARPLGGGPVRRARRGRDGDGAHGEPDARREPPRLRAPAAARDARGGGRDGADGRRGARGRACRGARADRRAGRRAGPGEDADGAVPRRGAPAGGRRSGVRLLLVPRGRGGLHDAGGRPDDPRRIRAGAPPPPVRVRAAGRGAGDDDRPRAPADPRRHGGPMNTRKQILLSAALVGAALGTVGLYGAIAAPESSGGAVQGHDHAAMAGAGGSEARTVRLDSEGARRIGVTYATAVLKPLRREVRTVGSVTYDETGLVNVNPRIEGWIERLHVDFTGAPVRKGQPLMEVHSPMLVSAQEELLLAKRLADEARAGGSERAARSAEELLDAARRRLLYWDIAAEEIARVEQSGTPRRTLTLRSPASGVVVEKTAIEGSRIMPGMDLFRIADLSRVWIDGEVFEKDLSLVRLGQHAEVTFEAYPGEVFDAVVSYVYPSV